MKKVSIKLGKVVRHDSQEFRIIYVSQEQTVLCALGTNKLDIRLVSTDRLFQMTSNGDFELQDTEDICFNEESLSTKDLEVFKKRKDAMQRITNEYGPTYMELITRKDKPIIKKILEEGYFTERSLRRMIVRYIQSGCKNYSLINLSALHKGQSNGERNMTKASGMGAALGNGYIRTQEVVEQFQECLECYKESGGSKTIKQVYETNLIGKYYKIKCEELDSDGNTIIVNKLKPEGERPTYRQFYYYLTKHLTPKERLIIEKGKKEYRNNSRILVGSSETGVYEPYELIEMDAVEFDVSLVDQYDRQITVGRPIIYMMKDVVTRMIIAVSIAFDNNSNIGCINCIANLVEDKKELCARYGIIITENMWPSGFKPRKLRFDNGSDFISKQIGEICAKLNIQRDIVPPGSGSMKAVIERSFHDAHDKLNHHFEGYGHITDKYGSTHHKDATVTIEEFAAMFYQYVVTYNNTLNTGIPLTPDMINKGVKRIPTEVFSYYLKLMTPQMMPYGDEFLKMLLTPATASITRHGILFKGLYYLNISDDEIVDKMQNFKSGRQPLKILYDPRTVNTVFYISNGRLNRAGLNKSFKTQLAYLDMTFKEYDSLKNKSRQLDKEAGELSMEMRINMYSANQNRVDAVKSKTKASPKNLRSNRENAKHARSKQLELDGRIGDILAAPQEPENPVSEEKPKPFERIDFLDDADSCLSPEDMLVRIAAGNFEEEA